MLVRLLVLLRAPKSRQAQMLLLPPMLLPVLKPMLLPVLKPMLVRLLVLLPTLLLVLKSQPEQLLS
jgi:hypothetical protein